MVNELLPGARRLKRNAGEGYRSLQLRSARIERLTPTLYRPSKSELCSSRPRKSGAREYRPQSPLQKLTRLVERAKLKPSLGEGFGRAFLAVDHGEHQHDLAAGVAHGLYRLQRRASGRGDVL